MGTNIFAFVIVLGVLIFFHELGHFLVARLFGVGVERFSLGFGPRIFGKKIGITDYRISAVPLRKSGSTALRKRESSPAPL